MSEWISVKDRMPKEGIHMLTFEDNAITIYIPYRNAVGVAPRNIGLFASGHPYVTHWMPLPEPPQ